MDTQKMICMRCGAWDDHTNRPDDALCGMNCSLLTKGKTCGCNCKLQIYNKNQQAREQAREKTLLNSRYGMIGMIERPYYGGHVEILISEAI